MLLTIAGAAYAVATPGAGSVALNVADAATEVPLDHPLLLTFTGPVSAADLARAFHVEPATSGPSASPAAIATIRLPSK